MKKFLFIILFLYISTILSIPNNSNKYINNEIKFINSLINKKQILKENIIHNTKLLMYNNAPDNNIDAAILVDLCLEYNIDIIFVLAQGILESNLGTKGVASRTNSVWNVGTFDDGSILYTYNNANESIEPYLKLIRNKYLINQDSIINEIDLLKTEFVDYRGLRYASNPKYEDLLLKIIHQLNKQYNITKQTHIYKQLNIDFI